MTAGSRILGAAALAVGVALAFAFRLLVVRTGTSGLAIGWPGGVLGSLRLDAVLSAAAAGAALGAAGAVLQSLLRNPLASPFVLGVSGGAGAGVALAAAIAAAAGAAAPQGAALGIPASAGALAALCAVLYLGRRGPEIEPVTLVLAGVIVGAVGAAVTTAAESLLPPDRRGLLAGWMLGRIPDAPDASVLISCAASAAGLVALGVALGGWLDAATLSDDEARAVGVPVGPFRTVMFAACGIATASTVVLCGPIAFVGLLAPHVARALVGAQGRWLVPGSAAAGAMLLVGADAIRQVVDVGGGRLPVGAVTAVLGGLAFLVLLRRTAGGWVR